jgi:hypothetical protein
LALNLVGVEKVRQENAFSSASMPSPFCFSDWIGVAQGVVILAMAKA